MWTQCVHAGACIGSMGSQLPTSHPQHPLNMHAEGGRSQSSETENTGNRAGGG